MSECKRVRSNTQRRSVQLHEDGVNGGRNGSDPMSKIPRRSAQTWENQVGSLNNCRVAQTVSKRKNWRQHVHTVNGRNESIKHRRTLSSIYVHESSSRIWSFKTGCRYYYDDDYLFCGLFVINFYIFLNRRIFLKSTSILFLH